MNQKKFFNMKLSKKTRFYIQEERKTYGNIYSQRTICQLFLRIKFGRDQRKNERLGFLMNIQSYSVETLLSYSLISKFDLDLTLLNLDFFENAIDPNWGISEAAMRKYQDYVFIIPEK